MRLLILSTLTVLALVAVAETAYFGWHLLRGRTLAAASTPFEQSVPDPTARLLVIGDSTAVGTGASRPADSVAGRLASAMPGLEVVNLAEDGALTRDLLGQLGRAPPGPYDAVLIQTGGNDILRLTPIEALRGAAVEVLSEARDRTSLVVMMSTGDVGTAPAMPPLIGWLYSARTRQARGLFLDLARLALIDYVDLYSPRGGGRASFQSDPQRYYASDGLHPSSAGFALWHEELERQSKLHRALMEAVRGR